MRPKCPEMWARARMRSSGEKQANIVSDGSAIVNVLRMLQPALTASSHPAPVSAREIDVFLRLEAEPVLGMIPGGYLMRTRLDRASIRRGLRVFFGLSVASIAIVVAFTDWEKTRPALARLRPEFLVVALLLAAVDWVGGGLRVYLLTRGLSGHISFRSAIKASLANTAMGAITPSQMGGGPAQVYLLYKNGLPFIEAMSASLMTFIVTILFFVVAAGVITFSGAQTTVTTEAVRHLFRYGVLAFMVCGGLFITFIARPSLLRLALRWLFNFLSLFRRRHFLRPGSRANRMIAATAEIHEINIDYIRNRFPQLVVTIVLTAILFGCKCFVAYFIVLGLGVQAGVWEVVSIQVLILLAVYFFPTPGGTGAAELGSAVLMAQILPLELLTIYVVLWRGIMMYIAVAIGSVIMLRTLGQDTVVAPRSFGDVEKKIAVSGERT